MKTSYFFICSVFLYLTGFGERISIDSLKLKLKQQKDDSVKVHVLSNLAWEYMNLSTDSSIMYGKKTIALAEKLKLPVLVALAKSDLGVFYEGAGNNKQALVFYMEALEQIVKQKNYKKAATVYNNIANLYKETGNFEKSAEFYLKSIKIREQLNDKAGLSQSFLNMGTLYLDIRNYDYTLNYLNKAMVLKKELGDKKGLAKVLNNLGLLYEDMHDTAMAMSYYFQSFKIKEELNDKKSMSTSLTNIGALYHNKKMYDSALYFLSRSLELKKEIGATASMPSVMIDIAGVQVSRKEYGKAIKNYTDALKIAEEVGSYEWELLCLYGLSRAYAIQNDKAKAYPLLLKYSQLKDSVYNSESTKKISELSAKYEDDKKEQEIRILKQQQEINTLQLEEKKLSLQTRTYLLAGCVVLILALMLAGYFYFAGQKLKARQQRDQVIKEAEENERMRLAKDIHDDLGSGLSKIKFLAELMVARTGHDPEIQGNVRSISATSVNLVENMRDLIWALNPENTSLESLVARIREYSSDYLADFPVELETQIVEYIPLFSITKEAHRNIFFIVKECLQNIIKHSEATKIKLAIEINPSAIVLSIADNGRGMNAAKAGGNGLANMKQRASVMGAVIDIISGQGLEVVLTVPLKSIKKA